MKRLGLLLAALLLSSATSAQVLQCQLAGQAPITLTLNLPTLTHQAARQSPQKAKATTVQGIIRYALPAGTYQLAPTNGVYQFTPKGKPTVKGICKTTVAAKPAPKACPSRRPYCKHIKTCEDALYLMNQCDFAELDSDGDGSPCEALCGDGR